MWRKMIAMCLVLIMGLSFAGCACEETICLKHDIVKDSSGKIVSVSKKTEPECYTFQPYGVADNDKRNDRVEYSVSVGNIIWSVILVETVVVPIVLIGWYLYEPIGEKVPGEPGAVVP